jgi:hypothetical protein
MSISFMLIWHERLTLFAFQQAISMPEKKYFVKTETWVCANLLTGQDCKNFRQAFAGLLMPSCPAFSLRPPYCVRPPWPHTGQHRRATDSGLPARNIRIPPLTPGTEALD